jgi:hypothetical protein
MPDIACDGEQIAKESAKILQRELNKLAKERRPMKKLSKKLVLDYHTYMSRKFHFQIIDKGGSDLMYLVSNALEILGIMDKDAFMKRYAITIVNPFTDEKFVYIPWTPGDGSQAARAMQIRVLAHETEHTIQGEDLKFVPRYFYSKSRRAHYEALAMRAELEIWYYLYGTPMDTARAAQRLKAYRVRSGDIRVTKKELDLANKVITRGAIGTDAGKAAISWLRRRLK